MEMSTKLPGLQTTWPSRPSSPPTPPARPSSTSKPPAPPSPRSPTPDRHLAHGHRHITTKAPQPPRLRGLFASPHRHRERLLRRHLQRRATRARYRGAVAKGITGNQRKRTQAGKDGLRLARRFRDHEDMIMRFTTDLAVGFTSNQAERDVRPVKVQMRSSGGCWRTLTGLADFAIVQSYLSTAGKWGIDALDALTRLFTGQPWLPPATAPP